MKKNRKFPLWGRELTIPESSGSIARFSFAELCNKPLSAADYLEVTDRFGTVFVEGIPRLGLEERDQARRFITFIDGGSSISQGMRAGKVEGLRLTGLCSGSML